MIQISLKLYVCSFSLFLIMLMVVYYKGTLVPICANEVICRKKGMLSFKSKHIQTKKMFHYRYIKISFFPKAAVCVTKQKIWKKYSK